MDNKTNKFQNVYQTIKQTTYFDKLKSNVFKNYSKISTSDRYMINIDNLENSTIVIFTSNDFSIYPILHCLNVDNQNFIEIEENVLNKFILKIKCYIAAIRNKSDTKYNMKLVIISKNIKLDFVEYIEKELYRMPNIHNITKKLLQFQVFIPKINITTKHCIRKKLIFFQKKYILYFIIGHL